VRGRADTGVVLAMTPWDEYRVKAAELHARAACDNDPALKTELESLARSYLRLAEQAEQNSRLDLTYETPLRKGNDPANKR
jgi:hypothetical protein